MRGARNSSRGTDAIASSTRSSVTPCGRSCSATIRCAGVLTQNRPISEVTISPNPLASSVHAPIPQKWRRPVRQRSRLVRRTGPAHSRVEFAHPSEQEFARFLDYYRIRWQYEPVSFPIAWEGTRVAEMFTPDFYLPEHDLYIELTTMKQSLVTPKNRKLRMLRELYPELNVRLLYRKDYQQLLVKAGYGALEVQHLRKEDVGEILISPVELETRVRALGRKISRDYRGQSLVLVGVLKGITFFMADLARQIKVPFVIDYLDLQRFAGAQPHTRVRIARDIDYPIEGRHVLLVEDIINTGLTLDYVLSELRRRQPTSLEVVTLLDRPLRRLVRVPMRYVGFQIPNDYVVGYGLDYRELYRNLPFICTLRPSVLDMPSAPAPLPAS
ncbi:MAG: hypoxanthine phosphoribosyltransferase [Chloroflexi bacterium]|nr:MAG: hypoxanthine phosphoribosyltransferase [Chloroflexota bacterium]TMG13211.1 MAG: hypoxanthine phosphoribosyltransferase [Chloroflexota bacterium]TMG59901.1 MAG: hypoxanthine phosphoribosyltransferase [Chloroflexota bacterium]